MINDLSKHWYLVQYKSQAYRVAQENLNRQGFETFLPFQQITKRKGSSFCNFLKPLFPGYMFVAFNLKEEFWSKINNTIGVQRLISFDGKPRSVPIDLIPGLMSRCDALGVIGPPKFISTGDSVELLSGSLCNFIATVEEIASEKRVWVLMEFMGQTRRISVKNEDLKVL